MNKPTLPPGEPQTASASESRRKYVNKATGIPENHDRTWAGAVDLPGGGRVWAAIVADGCGGDSRGTQVAEACVAAFRAAVAGSSAAELSDLARAKAWVARWGDALQSKIVDGPLKGGNSTLAAAVAVRNPAEPGVFSLLLLNVGDSPMFLYSGPGLRALNVTPDEPEDNPNAGAGGNGLRRAIGLPAAGGFPLMDVAIRRLPPEGGPYGLAVCSDGVTDYSKVATQGGVRTIKKLKLLNASGFRRFLASSMPFASRPAAILAESLAVARRRGVAETQMDNSSVALLGVGLEKGLRLPDAPTSSSRSRRRRLLLVSAAAAVLVIAGVLWSKDKEPKGEPDWGPGRGPTKFRIARTNAVSVAAASTNAVPTNAVSAVVAPVPAASTNAVSTNAAPAVVEPVPVAATNAQANVSVPSEGTANKQAPKKNSGKPIPYQPKPTKEKSADETQESSSAPAEEPASPVDPEAEWKEAEKTLDACLGVDQAKCFEEMERRLGLHPDWTNRLDGYYAARGLVPRIRFTNGAKTNLSVRTGGTNEFEIRGGGEKTSRLKNARFLESGSFSYRVVPAGPCEGCWNQPPEATADWRWNSGEIEVLLPIPTPKDKPVWTLRLPDSPPDSWRLERKEGDRWVSVPTPKDGRIEIAPHSDAAFRFDLGDRTQTWIVHAGHCGEKVSVEDQGVMEKPKFPSVRIENRGPRAVEVSFPSESDSRRVLQPFESTDFPVPQHRFSNETVFPFAIVDTFENSATTNEFGPRLVRGDDLKVVPFEPEPSDGTTAYLSNPDNMKTVVDFFKTLKKDLDSERNGEKLRKILKREGDFKRLAPKLMEPENASNVPAFLRWLLPKARTLYPDLGWPDPADEDWKKLETLWNEMHPAPVGPAEPEERKSSDGEHEWEAYVVQAGDKLEKLAKERLPDGSSIERFVSEICATNDIPDANKIKKGQKILLPPKK